MGQEADKICGGQSEYSNSSSRKKHLFAQNNAHQPQQPQPHVRSVTSSVKHIPNDPHVPPPPLQQPPVSASPLKDRRLPATQSVALSTSQVDFTAFSDIPPAQRYPTKISYFNAWSLPIQKYYIEERGPYQPEEDVAVQQRREVREFNSGMFEEIMAEKMKQEIGNQYRRRRQNLNMV